MSYANVFPSQILNQSSFVLKYIADSLGGATSSLHESDKYSNLVRNDQENLVK